MSKSQEPERKRRGKVKKPKEGAPAEFVPGGGEAPKEFDAGTLAERFNLWWENGTGEKFLVKDEDDEVWSEWPEGKIVKLLRSHYVRIKPREGETLSEADRVLLHVMKKRRLELSLPALAGYPAGLYDVAGLRMMVRQSPRLVVPVEGDWDTVRALIAGKLDLSVGGTKPGPDQTSYFHAWMKSAIEALYGGGPGNFRPGQCCIFAGPRDSGKSRIQHQVITGLLGGRSADPGPYLFGRTDFNGEMFAAEHLMMEDPASSTKTADRVYFGEMLKQLVVNDTQRLHEKRENAITVAPFFRTTISINDDPDKMRVLPLLTPDMKDKVHLFLVSADPLPMPTGTLDERQAFRTAIKEQLPAYAYWLLNEFEIPENIKGGRFGVKEWHHPTLAMELFDDTPAAELLSIIDAARFSDGLTSDMALWDLSGPDHSKAVPDMRGILWEGTAIDLEKFLLSGGGLTCSVEREAKRLCMHNKVDRLLSRLKEDQPLRVEQRRTARERRWILTAPPSV